MYDVSIKVVKVTKHEDLINQYEVKLNNPCFMNEGMTFISVKGEMPKGFCPEAWKCIEEYVARLSRGEINLFGKWLKNKRSVILSCNDGCRPVSFLIEAIH